MPNSQEMGLFQLLDLGLLDPGTTAILGDSGLLISAINITTAQHNSDIDGLLRLFATTTTDYQQEVQQSGSSRNQPLDENGRAIPIKPPPPYTVAYPLQGSGSAMGANYVTRVQMNNRDLARQLSMMYQGDYIWVRDHVLGAIFANTSYTFRDPTGKGNLTIRGPANGDTIPYFNQFTQGIATETHFLAQAAGIADATNPYTTIVSRLLEHPTNSGEVISFIPTNLKATTLALAEFRTAALSSDIQLGNNVTRLVGDLNVTLPAGAAVLGKTDSGSWIVEWPALPSGYIISITTNGARPLARRQFPEQELQGFRAVGERNDFPYFETQWMRWEGYGAYNRTGVVVTQVGSGSYSVPTNYSTPMP